MEHSTIRQSLYSEVTTRIIAELEQGRLPWLQPWDTSLCGCTMPHNAATDRRYSGINVLILWAEVVCQGYGSQRWLTYRQAQAAGGNVRKGEKGTTVCYADRFTPKAEAEQALGEDREARTVAFLKRFTVFNVDQCEGLPEDMSVMATAGHFACEEKVVRNRAELLSLLDCIASSATEGLRPILHFDCHGSAAEGLHLRPADEFCSWEDLAARLRIINVATRNNLCCVFATCFGMWLATQLQLSLPAPWYLTIAPQNEISVGVLEERIAEFYREVFASANITQAYDRVFKPDLDILLCKKVFAESLARHVAVNCRGDSGRQRKEAAVTAVLTRDGIVSPTRAQLAQARREVRHKFQASQWVIDHFAGSFLIGRDPGIDVADLVCLADNYARREQRRRELARKLSGKAP